MKHFWNWHTPPDTPIDGNHPASETSRVLRINGVIAEESWFDDDITPGVFASELNAGSGPVTVWLNSPGGDVVAAAQIYNMLATYPGHVRVNIDGIAASAASVIAMAGDTVAMSPVSMLMIHNPATLAVGDKDELARAMSMLEAVKDSIINAYQTKTGLSRAKLSKLMDAETWMDARAAIEMGFADHYLTNTTTHPETDEDDDDEAAELTPEESGDGDSDETDKDSPPSKRKLVKNRAPSSCSAGGVIYSRKPAEQLLVAHFNASPVKPARPLHPIQPAVSKGRRVVDLYAALTDQPH